MFNTFLIWKHDIKKCAYISLADGCLHYQCNQMYSVYQCNQVFQNPAKNAIREKKLLPIWNILRLKTKPISSSKGEKSETCLISWRVLSHTLYITLSHETLYFIYNYKFRKEHFWVCVLLLWIKSGLYYFAKKYRYHDDGNMKNS